ncbi:hypothetical protein ACJX0J_014249, partial [Zea mays]
DLLENIISHSDLRYNARNLVKMLQEKINNKLRNSRNETLTGDDDTFFLGNTRFMTIAKYIYKKVLKAQGKKKYLSICHWAKNSKRGKIAFMTTL